MRVALIALLALAACGGRPTDVLGERLTPGQEACRQEARRSPEVTRLSRETNPFADYLNESRLREERRIAETRAWRACLRERGLTQPGGVEIIRGL